MNISFKLVSALTKVIHESEPASYPVGCSASLLRGEVFSLQAAYCLNEDVAGELPQVNIHLACGLPVTVRQVFGVPVRFPHFGDSDDDYLRPAGSIYPDLLRAIHTSGNIRLYPRQWDAFWLDIESMPGSPAGDHPLKISMTDTDGKLLAEKELVIRLIDRELGKQKLVHSRWLYADSLAAHYQVPIQSVEHNRILRNFVSLAARRGMNMVLTPIHTPPLMTAYGSDRQTVQLVDIFKTPLGYTFRFPKLRDFISMCRHEGIRYFEMAHLFSARDGLYAAKIMGIRDGSYTQLFGWDTRADSPEYLAFLAAYLDALRNELSYLDALDKSYFHLFNLTEGGSGQYAKLLDALKPQLEGLKVIDLMPGPRDLQDSPEQAIPVLPTSRLAEEKTPVGKERWAYYSRHEHKGLSNTFIAMPGLRTRILGVQLYLQGVSGFLHWGYNYYFSQYALYPIDPYLNTDCSGFSPAGDAFQVYPGEGGQPEESLRLMLFLHAMQDLRAFEMLEKQLGRDGVIALIHEGLAEKITMDVYPTNEAWLLCLRQRVNERLAQIQD